MGSKSSRRNRASIVGDDIQAQEKTVGAPTARIVVVDDDQEFLESIVDGLREVGFAAEEFASVVDFARAARSGELHGVGLMLFDMNLELRGGGGVMKAPDAILIAKTYVPQAYILVFTSPKIALDDAIECVNLGALGLVPKPMGREDLLKVAKVYAKVGNAEHASEAVLKELWRELLSANRESKGQLFEMFVANLLSSVNGLSMIANNWNSDTGEADLIFRNDIKDKFWKNLGSLFLIVECKNRIDPSQVKDFHVLKAKVNSKWSCNVGIIISWVDVSSGYKTLQQKYNQDKEIMFLLNRRDLQELVSMRRVERQAYLTRLFSHQR